MQPATTQPNGLGQYQVTGTLAVGRTWRIYRGFDPILGRNLALKAIPKALLESSGLKAQLQSEVRTAARLKHPGIVEIYDYGEDAGLAFVAMEYVEGWYLKERFRVPLADAVNLVVQLLEALDYAHEHGVVHSAIKPSNLLLSSHGHLRITNFGVTRLGANKSNYASPEQLTNSGVDRRSDVFSAGVVFYELLTGTNPFAGSSREAVDARYAAPRPPSEIDSKVPRTFDPVCARSLAKVREDRYARAREFCDGVRGAFATSNGSRPSRILSRETVSAFRSAAGKDRGDSGAPPRHESQANAVLPDKPQAPLSSSKARPIPSPGGPRPAPERKPEIPVGDKPDAAEVKPPKDLRPALEEMLGKQPSTLAAYLKDSSPRVDDVIHAFTSSTKALIEMYAANGKNEALIPQNICFDRLGKATIRVPQATAAQGTSVLSNPRYAAPEMFAEKSPADSASATANIYALGFMFYEILLGKTLFAKTFSTQRSDLDWLRWHADLQSKAPPLKSLLPDCPVALSDTVESMMEKNLEKRTKDLQEILTRLRSIQQRANKTIVLRSPTPQVKPVEARETAPPRKARWRKLTLLAVAVLMVLLAGFLFWQDPNLFQDLISYLQQLFERRP